MALKQYQSLNSHHHKTIRLCPFACRACPPTTATLCQIWAYEHRPSHPHSHMNFFTMWWFLLNQNRIALRSTMGVRDSVCFAAYYLANLACLVDLSVTDTLIFSWAVLKRPFMFCAWALSPTRSTELFLSSLFQAHNGQTNWIWGIKHAVWVHPKTNSALFKMFNNVLFSKNIHTSC